MHWVSYQCEGPERLERRSRVLFTRVIPACSPAENVISVFMESISFLQRLLDPILNLMNLADMVTRCFLKNNFNVLVSALRFLRSLLFLSDLQRCINFPLQCLLHVSTFSSSFTFWVQKLQILKLLMLGFTQMFSRLQAEACFRHVKILFLWHPKWILFTFFTNVTNKLFKTK